MVLKSSSGIYGDRQFLLCGSQESVRRRHRMSFLDGMYEEIVMTICLHIDLVVPRLCGSDTEPVC
jgi:hypothetical protein